jgi:catechol 2,3-dioxygenase-like lactoylglutathione lyase family enzyme
LIGGSVSNDNTRRYAEHAKQLVAEVFVLDIERSLAFYRQLGFELQSRHGGFAVLTWDDHEFFLDERPDLPPRVDALRVNIRVMVPDVDAYWGRALQMGAQVAAPIEDREYGLRDFTIIDPDGCGVRFGTWISG